MRSFLLVVILFLQLGLNANSFKQFNRSNGLASDKINVIVSDNQYLWLATEGGVNRLTIEGENIKEISGRITTRPVNAIVNEETFLWVGIQGKGLYKLYKEGYVLTGIYPSIFGKENVQYIEKSNNKIIVVTESKKAFEFSPLDSSIVELTLNGTIDSIGVSENALRYLRGLKNSDHVYVKNNELWIGRNKVLDHNFDLSKPIATYKTGAYLIISNNTHLWKYSITQNVLLDYQLEYNLAPFTGYKYKGMSFLASDRGLLLYSEQLDTLKVAELVVAQDTVPLALVDTAKLDTIPLVPEGPKKPMFSFDNLDYSIVNIVLASLGFVAYTVLLIWLTSFKYKRDIKTLEDELLRKMKGKGEV